MNDPIHGKIKRSLQAAEGLYHHLILLVGETGILGDIVEKFDSSVVNGNLALSGELMERSPSSDLCGCWTSSFESQIKLGHP